MRRRHQGKEDAEDVVDDDCGEFAGAGARNVGQNRSFDSLDPSSAPSVFTPIESAAGVVATGEVNPGAEGSKSEPKIGLEPREARVVEPRSRRF